MKLPVAFPIQVPNGEWRNGGQISTSVTGFNRPMDPAVENNLRKREIYDLLDHAVNFGFYDLIKEIDRAILEEFGEIEVD